MLIEWARFPALGMKGGVFGAIGVVKGRCLLPVVEL